MSFVPTLRAAVILVLTVGPMAACGVDGPPERPAAKPQQSGVQVSGEARIGVQGRL